MVVDVKPRSVRAEASISVYCSAAVALMLGLVGRITFPFVVRRARQSLTPVNARALLAAVMIM